MPQGGGMPPNRRFLTEKTDLLGQFSLPEVFCGPQICQKCVGVRGLRWGSSRRFPEPLIGWGPPQSAPLSAPLAPRFSRLRRSASVPPNVKSWLRPWTSPNVKVCDWISMQPRLGQHLGEDGKVNDERERRLFLQFGVKIHHQFCC